MVANFTIDVLKILKIKFMNLISMSTTRRLKYH